MSHKDPKKRRAYYKAWYKKNAKRERTKLYVQKTKRRILLQQITDQLKNIPCMDCGNKYPPVCMDFDHIRGKKLHNVSQIVRDVLPKKVLLAEVKKCEIVCANCHRLRTQYRLRAGNTKGRVDGLSIRA